MAAVASRRAEAGEVQAERGDLREGEPARDDLDFVYAFVYRRVGNREDAQDLTQEVALKALGRLQVDRPMAQVRAYLVATARSVLANFWTDRLRLPVSELRDGHGAGREAIEAPEGAIQEVERILSLLPPNYRLLLELRFLRGYSTKEVAKELGTTVGAVKVMQLRALRAAARLSATD
jgi:RNA polymerase sigma-70 factor (ECF subfamily)